MTGETDQNPDLTLLKAWTNHRDREAIGRLIERHINFVYAVAYRQVRGNSHLAEDITQAVFILLLQKAHRIQSEAAMASWLFTTTRYAAANALKLGRRRDHYELQAAQMTPIQSKPEHDQIDSLDIQPLLNDAINSLPKSDRVCVIMSYLQQQSHRQIAAAIGVSEEAARKRVSRAVERMREFVAARGAVVPATAIVISLTKHSTVSAQFIESTVNIATLSQSAVQSGSAFSIAKAVSNMMFMVKLKIATTVVVLFCGGVVAAQVVERALSRQAAVVVAGQIQDASNTDPSAISLGDGVSVNFLGVARWETDDWYGIDGKPVAKPSSNHPRMRMTPPPTYQVLIRVISPQDAIADVRIPQAENFGNMISVAQNGTRDFTTSFSLRPGETSADLNVQIADGPWKTALTTRPNSHVVAMNTPTVQATFTPLMERDGKTIVFVSASHVNGPWRLVFKDVNGQETIADEAGGAGNDSTTTCEFRCDLAPVTIDSLELQVRPYRKHVIAKNITLDPAKPTTPQISVEKSD